MLLGFLVVEVVAVVFMWVVGVRGTAVLIVFFPPGYFSWGVMSTSISTLCAMTVFGPSTTILSSGMPGLCLVFGATAQLDAHLSYAGHLRTM